MNPSFQRVRPCLSRLLSLLVILGVSLAGCQLVGCQSTPDPDPSFAAQTPPLPNSDVPTFRGNAARTGRMPGPGPSGTDVSTKWVVGTGAPVYASPVVAGGVLYVGSSDGLLYAVDTEQGTIQWDTVVTVVSEQAAAGSATVADSTVYVGLKALDAQTGEVRWDAAEQNADYGNPASAVVAAPAVQGEVVYVTTSEQLVALDAATGARRWAESPLIPTYLYAPTVAEGIVFGGHPYTTYAPLVETGRTGPGSNRIGMTYARQTRDGSRQWHFTDAERNPPFFFPNPMGEGIPADEGEGPAAASRHNGSTDSPVPPTSAASRGVTPTMTSYGPLGSATAAVANGMLYTQTHAGVVYALDATTGAPIWTLDTASDAEAGWLDAEDEVPRISASPAIANETVYIGAENGSVYALDARDGTVQWTAELGGAIRSSPAVTDEALYVGSTDGHLYALDRATGAVTRRFATGGPIVSSPAVTGGVVYFGSHDEHIYALE